MSPNTPSATENLKLAQQRAMAKRPVVGGFPVLAEVLRQAGVRRNIWHLPSAQSLYLTDLGPVISQGTPLLTGFSEVPPFNRDKLIEALRADQSGRSTFGEFLQAAWDAGVVRYEVDFDARVVTYLGVCGTTYEESYSSVDV